ncbi:MAG: ATP-binding domain-containing protein [Acidiferrobacter sp.]
MATLRPSLQGLHAERPGEQREFDVLRQLETELPDDITVFHGVAWSSVHDGIQWFGELDGIVLAPNGNLVLLEVKAGPVEFTAQGPRKRYGDRTKDISRQARVQHAALRQRLRDSDLHVHIAHLLVLPDQVVPAGTIGYPRERIVDANDMPDLARRMLDAIPAVAAQAPTVERLRHFLDDIFDLSTDPSARIHWLGAAVTRLSEGLATWVPRITAPGGIFRIEATAGSGKTQLALRLLERSAILGARAQYVCYNRPLADQMRRIGPAAVHYATFHELAIACLRSERSDIDFTDPTLFARAIAQYGQSPAETAWDLLVIDEVQDFDAEWIEALRRRLRLGGRIYLLGDFDQQMRATAAGAWTDAVTVQCADNFRSPRQIVQCINALGLASLPITARAPLDGELPGFHVWAEDDPGGVQATETVVERLLDDGITPDQMALLSAKGRQSSRLLRCPTLAGVTLKTFTGDFDAAGHACWTEGELLADTIFRFKGQAAPVVVLVELDFAELDHHLRRLLFTGMTRAQWRLECVMSAQAERVLMAVLA